MNQHMLRRFLAETPLLSDAAVTALLSFDLDEAHLRQVVDLAAEPSMFKAFRQEMAPKMERVGGLAVIPISGILASRPSVPEMLFAGVEDTRSILAMVNEAAADQDIQGALLDLDTPGGMMMGGADIADAVARCRKKKPVVAHSGGMMASLGYWIGSQASEVVTSRHAVVGSIGTIASFVDTSKAMENMGVKVRVFTNSEGTFKGAGMPGTTLTESQAQHIQARLDAGFATFKGAVKARRPDVPDSSMKGQTFYGHEAKSLGLVDRIGDRSFALDVLRGLVRDAK